MTTHKLSAYRAIVRELNKASISSTRSSAALPQLKALFKRVPEGNADLQRFDLDMENVVTFLRSQRTHKALLERYNPLHDLTDAKRIEATAHRVGLNMPITPKIK